jgi:hypothetical protein
MNNENLYNAADLAEAEKIFRSDGFPLDTEALSYLVGRYMESGNTYKAYALIADYYELSKPIIDIFYEDGQYVSVLETMDFLFRSNNDRKRTLFIASLLVEEYKKMNAYTQIIELNLRLIKLCGNPASDSAFYLITKEAITASLDYIETTADMPSEEMLAHIGRTLLYLFNYSRYDDFIIETSRRIVSGYSSESEICRRILAYICPEMKRSLTVTLQGFRSVQQHDFADAATKNLEQCVELLFEDNPPPVFDGQEQYRVLDNEESTIEYLDMISKRRFLVAEIEELRTRPDADKISELKGRFIEFLDYFRNVEISKDTFDQIQNDCYIISTLAFWRDFDVDFVVENIAPYAERIALVQDIDSLSVHCIYSLQLAYFTLADVYIKTKEKGKQFECYVKSLGFGNQFFKKISFENSFAYFVSQVKDEYFFYYDMLVHIFDFLEEEDYPLEELYIELSKRKNLLYLGETWKRGNPSIEFVHSFLNKRDFKFSDLCRTLPKDAVFIDMYYIRAMYMDESEGEEPQDKTKAVCVAFVILPNGQMRYCFVGEGSDLAANLDNDLNGSYKQFLYNEQGWNEWIHANGGKETAVDYFKNITERLLSGVEPNSRVFVCTEGDLNFVSFAALPYKDGYVTDYFAVRNVTSVYDVVEPNRRKEVRNALVFSAPEYGQKVVSMRGEMWGELNGSALEGRIVAETLSAGGSSVDYLTSRDASLVSLKEKLSNANYGIIHFSTHGFVDNNHVGLVTAGANNPKTDSLLMDNDISAYSLADAQLIVYALCFGASQTAKLQDSLGGFIKASLMAGANSVIAPVYPIDDVSTAVLMDEFYKQLFSGESVDIEIALRKAIYRLRTITKKELGSEYGIQIDSEKDCPYNAPDYWTPWLCFSAETSVKDANTASTPYISPRSALREYLHNEEFRKVLRSNHFVYADRTFFITAAANRIDRDKNGKAVLPRSMREDFRMNALSFEYRTIFSSNGTTRGGSAESRLEVTKEQKYIATPQNARVVERAKVYNCFDEAPNTILGLREQSLKAYEFQKAHTKTCWQRIWEILEQKHARPSTFGAATMLNEDYYYKAKNDNPSPPDIRTIVAIAVGYNLGRQLTDELLKLAGKAFSPTSDEHNAYEFVISHMSGYSMEEINDLLISENISPLGTKSRK